MATYPNAIKTFTNPLSTDYQDIVPHASQHTFANDEINAIETELGTAPSGTHSDVATRFGAIDTLTTNMSGTIVSLGTAGTSTAPYFNVLDYGTAYTEATIQAACDAGSATGGVVYVPHGTWTIGSSITLYSNMTIKGDGEATLLRLGSGVNQSVITNQYWSHSAAGDPYNVNINIYDLMVDGNKAQNSGTDSHGGVSIKGIIGCRIMNCTIGSVYGYGGIYVSGASLGVGSPSRVENMVAFNKLIGNSASNVGLGAAIYFTATANHTMIIMGNYCEGNFGRQIFCEDFADTAQIIGNYVLGTNGTAGTSSVAGISTGNAQNTVVSGNQVLNCDVYGIEIGGSKTVCTNNIVQGCNNTGIIISGGHQVINGNITFNNGQTTAASGIHLKSGVTYSSITGNQSYDTQGTKTQTNGISEEGTSTNYNVFTGNVCYANKTNNLYIQGANSIYQGTVFNVV